MNIKKEHVWKTIHKYHMIILHLLGSDMTISDYWAVASSNSKHFVFSIVSHFCT